MSEIKKENPLEMLPINKLLVKFSVPSIIAMLVTALYNIVDQFFIGQAVGSLGNAATSISFPLVILTAGGGHLIRADGNPNMAMICNLIGAVINTVLDAIFVFGLHLRKLLAADNINIPYGNRKTKGRYVFVSYKTDNLFTSISYCVAAYHGNRRNNVCRTDSGRTCSSRSYCYDKNRIFERGI